MCVFGAWINTLCRNFVMQNTPVRPKLSKWTLRGAEAHYIMRRTGKQDREYAKQMGVKCGRTCHNWYNEGELTARHRDGLIDLVGMRNYEFYLREYRNRRGIDTID